MEKKIYIVTIIDGEGNGYLEGPFVFPIRASSSDKAIECAEEIFVEEYGFDRETVDFKLEFDAYEFNEGEIIDAED